MAKSKATNDAKEINDPFQRKTGDLFNDEKKEDEIESGSASAFDETESVNEDNFDDLSEK